MAKGDLLWELKGGICNFPQIFEIFFALFFVVVFFKHKRQQQIQGMMIFSRFWQRTNALFSTVYA